MMSVYLKLEKQLACLNEVKRTSFKTDAIREQIIAIDSRQLARLLSYR